MLKDLLQELKQPEEIGALVQDIALAPLPQISLDASDRQKDLFSLNQRKAWDKSVEARCDFSYCLRLTRRASTNFISIWQKSVFGKTLTEIKRDDAMIPFFISSLAPVIRECIGYHIAKGSWALVTTPMRRHRMEQASLLPSSHPDALLPSSPAPAFVGRNFASLIAQGLADDLGVPFYFDCAHCRSKQRIGAVFDANNIPREPNVIVFDDFVTTGSTLLAMKNLLQSLNKNVVFFAGINNKL